MRRPTSHEIKRKIDSKIFELQSSLLDEGGGISEALLAECARWFRPQHLQDIVIERSEAEHRCGWPGCDNGLSSSRCVSPLMLGVPDGEEFYRFCCRACMAKTRALLSAIPTTSPYSREGILRLALPPPQASEFDSQGGGGGDEGTGEKSTKKIYKRPRMRKTSKDSSLPAKPAESVSGADALGEVSGGPAGRSGQEDPSPEVKVERTSERDSPGLAVAATDGERGREGTGNDANNDVNDCDVAGGGGHEDVVETLQAELERVSISEGAPRTSPPASASASPSSCVSESGGEKTPVPQAATEPGLESVSKSVSQASARSPPPPPSSRPTPVPTTTIAPSPGVTAWESMKFRRSSGAPSAVSLQASLVVEATAAAAETAVAASADTCIAPAAKTAEAATAAAVTTTTSRHGIIRVEQQEDRRGGETDKGASSSKSRRKSVSFADGTKEDPRPSTTGAGASSRGSSIPASGVSGRTGKRRGRERRRGRGGRGGVNSAGRSKGIGSPGDETVVKPVVLEKVVEREPSVPTPMEAKVTGEGRAGAVEGHLPSIEADLSFRVMPRGYFPQGRGVPLSGGVGGGGGVEEEKGGGDLGLGVGVDDIEVMGNSVDRDLVDGDPVDGDVEKEEEEEDGDLPEGAEGAGKSGNNDEDDENDRAIWRKAFGSEMPPEISEGPWIDMDAVHDKELREEYASSIGSFALLWNALSEWVTPDTRAVCHAGRAAANATDTDNAAKAADPVVDRTERPSFSSSLGHLRARQASAVAAATEAEAHRRPRRGIEGGSADAAAGDASPGPTVTGALRHSGLSTMVKMHLGQAERLLLREMMHDAGVGRGRMSEKGGITGGSTRKWTWSEEASANEKRHSGRGRPGGGWVEATEEKLVDCGKDAEVLSRRVRTGDGGRERLEEGGEKSFASTEPGGSAECRRALSAVIETMDAGRASAAANLSIAQWKVVPLVLLTAVGLGGSGGGGGGGDKGFVEKEEAVRGAEACARLCEAEAMISAREFEMLVEVLLES